jgi:hypothetical protein
VIKGQWARVVRKHKATVEINLHDYKLESVMAAAATTTNGSRDQFGPWPLLSVS